MVFIKPLQVTIELDRVQEAAEETRELLQNLRSKYDLAKWEYTQQVRIAPFEIPHSHPVLTLNSINGAGPGKNEDKLLACYLHEQIHWALDGCDSADIGKATDALMNRYPLFHVGLPVTAQDEPSTYLHFIVNWLELSALKGFLGAEKAENLVRSLRFYTKIYDRVVLDFEQIGEILEGAGIYPLPVKDKMAG